MFAAHEKPLVKSYRVSYCSLGAFFWATTIVAIVLTPLYVAWLSHSFWINEKVVYEQPQVLDNGQFIVIVEGFRTTSTTPEPFQVVATSSSAVNGLLGSVYRAPVYQVSTSDRNRDGLIDQLSATVGVPISASESVYRVQYLSSVSVNFKSTSNTVMDGLISYVYESALPGSGASASGVLKLTQAYPWTSSVILTSLYKDAVLPLATVASLADLDLGTILSAYSDRNVTTQFGDVVTHWRTDVAAGAATGLPFLPRQFMLSLNVHIRDVPLRVFPFISETVKWAWVQYCAILWVVVWLIGVVRSFVFSQGIVSSYVVTDSAKRVD